MSYQVNCEDFAVTDAMSQAIEERLEQLRRHLKRDHHFEVFVKKEGPSDITVQIDTHHNHKDMSASGKNTDFYTALNQARTALGRQLDDAHSRESAHRR